MDIAVIGAGVVGQATGKGFARLGHKVVFYDLNDEVRKKLKGEGCDARFHGQSKAFDVIFVCTPESMIEIDLWKEWYQGLIVIRSTVPVGTCAKYEHVCHNPEFLREAVAEYEFMNPNRVVIGECCKEHGDILEALYKPLSVPIIRVNPTTSEMIKLASNAYLATQVSYWNQISLICEKLGVNSHVVGKACSFDPRISEYGASMHGKAYGGKCLPKDLAHLKTLAMQKGVTSYLLDAVKGINECMKVKK